VATAGPVGTAGNELIVGGWLESGFDRAANHQYPPAINKIASSNHRSRRQRIGPDPSIFSDIILAILQESILRLVNHNVVGHASQDDSGDLLNEKFKSQKSSQVTVAHLTSA
jgi:hypothetical protein